MKKALTIAALGAAFVPAIASAQGNSGVLGLLDQAEVIINRLLPFVITLTVLVFLWGIFRYVMSGGDTEQRKEARGFIIWGIIALFVMVSVWGLVNILSNTIRPDNTPPPAPGTTPPGGTYNR